MYCTQSLRTVKIEGEILRLATRHAFLRIARMVRPILTVGRGFKAEFNVQK